MPVIGSLIVSLGANNSALNRGLAEGQTAIERFAQSGPTSGGATGAANSGPASDVGSLGSDLQGAMFAGMAPLASIGNKIAAQFNAVGGTITTLARRIDGAMKFPLMDATLGKIQGKIENPFLRGAIGATRSILRIRDALSHMGDVAGRGLDRVSRINFNGPVASSGMLARNFRTIAPAANAATTAVKGLGFQIAAAFGVVGIAFKAGQMLKDFFVGGIKGASDLNETLSKTKEVFGADAMAPIVAQADEMGRKFGLVKGPILDASASIGLIGKAGGQSNAEAAKMAVNLTRLAADASSFYNVPLETALEKIRSGLVGEAEPMRGFGVLLSETAVKAEAQALGLAKGKGLLDERTKVMARASLITKGLATAEGDLARTSDSASNQFRKAGGGLENFSTQVGALLLPAVKAGTLAFNDLLATTLDVFEANRPMIEGWGESLAGTMETVGRVTRNFGAYAKIGWLMFLEGGANVLSFVEVLPRNLSILANYVANNWANLIIDAVNAVSSVFMNLGTNIQVAFKAAQDFIAGKEVHLDFVPLLDGFKATADKLPEFIKPGVVSMQGEIDKLYAGIETKEKARKAAIAGPAKPAAAFAKEASKTAEYHATAAVEIGSAEAGSAIAKFLNQSKDEKVLKKMEKLAEQQLEEQRLQRIATQQIANGQGGFSQAQISALPLGT